MSAFSFDLSKLELPRNVSFPDVKLPDVKFPDVKLPDVKLPTVKLPEVKLPEVDVDRVVDVARDAAYVGIGLTVLGIQQAQVRRRDLQAQLERGVRAVRDRVA